MLSSAHWRVHTSAKLKLDPLFSVYVYIIEMRPHNDIVCSKIEGCDIERVFGGVEPEITEHY